jgi:hypothetical protein
MCITHIYARRRPQVLVKKTRAYLSFPQIPQPVDFPPAASAFIAWNSKKMPEVDIRLF